MICPCRRLGGKVFTADSTKPPPRWPKVFAVCPASLTWEAEASLVAADASFRLVHPSCRVTTHWMDICVKVGGKGGGRLERSRSGVRIVSLSVRLLPL